jgi:2-methylcitrate dehydratase
MAMTGEMGCATALTAPRWGFQDVLFGGETLELSRPLGSYVMENILLKVSFPAEFHAQTAVEAAIQLHPLVRHRLDAIARIELWTQESAIRIIDKTGPLRNPADRDHCLQYMVAVGLRFGELRAEHYEDAVAADPSLDRLRALMTVTEDASYTRDYLDPEKRSIANAIRIVFRDGTTSERVEVAYPVGHKRRQAERAPLLREKFERHLAAGFKGPGARAIRDMLEDPVAMDQMPVKDFMALWVPEGGRAEDPR